MSSQTDTQSVEAYPEVKDIPLPLDEHESLAKHLICDETRLEELPSVPRDSYQNPASIGSQGNSTHTDDIYGNPPSAGSFGNPSSISSYGNPESISSYGNPASISSYGNPQSANSYGNPPSINSYGNPASIGENCGNIANTGNYGKSASTSNHGNPASTSNYGNPASTGENYGNVASTDNYMNPGSVGSFGNPQSVGSYSNPVTPRESHENLSDIPDSFTAPQTNQDSQNTGITHNISTHQQDGALPQGTCNTGRRTSGTATEHNPRIAEQLSVSRQYYSNNPQYNNQAYVPNQQQYRQQTHSYGTTQGGSLEHMRKRRRFEYEDWQTDYLEKCYRRNHYPGKYDKDEMSVYSKLSQDRIKSWFQNRRARDRKKLKGCLTPGAPIPQGSVTVLEPTDGRRLQPSSVQWGGMNAYQSRQQQQLQRQPQQHMRQPQVQQKGVVPQQMYSYYYGAVSHNNPPQNMGSNAGGLVGARPPQPVRMVVGYPGQERVLNRTHSTSLYSSYQSTETNQYQDSRARSGHAPLAMVPITPEHTTSDVSSSSSEEEDEEDEKTTSQHKSAEAGLNSAVKTAVVEPIKTAEALTAANPSGTYVSAGSVQDMTSYVDPRMRSLPEYLMRYGTQMGQFPNTNQLQQMQVARGYASQNYMNMQQYAATEQWRQAYLGHYMYQNNNRGAETSTYPNFYPVIGQKDPNSMYFSRQFMQTSRQEETSVPLKQNSYNQMPTAFTMPNKVATETSVPATQEYAGTTSQTTSYGDIQDYNNNHTNQMDQYISQMFNTQTNLPSMEAFRRSSSTSTSDSPDNELSHTPASSNITDIQSPPATPGEDSMKALEPELDFENIKPGTNAGVCNVAPSTFQSEYSNRSQESVSNEAPPTFQTEYCNHSPESVNFMVSPSFQSEYSKNTQDSVNNVEPPTFQSENQKSSVVNVVPPTFQSEFSKHSQDSVDKVVPPSFQPECNKDRASNVVPPTFQSEFRKHSQDSVSNVVPSTFKSKYNNHSQDVVNVSFDEQVENDPFSVMTQSPVLTPHSDHELSKDF